LPFWRLGLVLFSFLAPFDLGTLQIVANYFWPCLSLAIWLYGTWSDLWAVRTAICS